VQRFLVLYFYFVSPSHPVSALAWSLRRLASSISVAPAPAMMRLSLHNAWGAHRRRAERCLQRRRLSLCACLCL